MTRLLVALMVGCMSLVGCMAPDPGDGNATTSPEPELPPPVATFTAAPAHGTPPLDVTFSLHFHLNDSQVVRWMLDVGADGSFERSGSARDGDVKTHDHTFPEGTHAARALVSEDGTVLLDETIQVVVTEEFVSQVFTADGEEYDTPCSTVDEYHDNDDVPEVGDKKRSDNITSRFDVRVDPDTWGQTYQATWSFNASFTEGWAIFTTHQGNIQDSGSDGGGPAHDLIVTGHIPKHADWLVLIACGKPGVFTVDYVTPA